MTTDGLTILVGTTKGAFLIDGGKDRSGWTVRGPFCNGWPPNHVIGDPATGTRLADELVLSGRRHEAVDPARARGAAGPDPGRISMVGPSAPAVSINPVPPPCRRTV